MMLKRQEDRFEYEISVGNWKLGTYFGTALSHVV